MADFWKGVQENLKRGYSPAEIVDSLADGDEAMTAYVSEARANGAADKDLIIKIGDAITAQNKPAAKDPYVEASKSLGGRKSLVPLGAAMAAPAAGVRQMLGDEHAGLQAKEAEAGIERSIPGGRAGLLAGKVGIGSAAAAPFAGIGAGMTGAAGLATRAVALAVPTAAYRATDPMAADESRMNQTLVAGGTAALLSPVGEGVAAIAGKGFSYITSKAADLVRKHPRLAAMAGSQSSATADAAAEASLRFSLRQEGVNYDALSKEIKQQLIKEVGQHLNPSGLGQNALVRAALVEQQLGPDAAATLGQANRSTEQMRFEQQFGGEQMMQRQAAQSAAIENKLRGMSERIGGPQAERGVPIQAAVLAKHNEADKAVTAAYKLADESVGDVPVSVDALGDVISVNTSLTPGVDVLVAKLKKAGVKFDDNGDLILGQMIPAKVANEIRKAASNMTAPGSQSAGVGVSIKRAIDGTFLDSGIPQYKDAAKLARANFAQFEDREIPATIIATRHGAGIETMQAPSTIPDWLVSMPHEKLREFKKFLIEGNEPELAKIYAANPEMKRSGVKGMRALKATVIDSLLKSATRKSSTAEGGQYIVSPDALVTAYRKIGEAKLAAVLDAKDFANLRAVVKAAEVVTTPGRAQMKGSADANTALVRWFAERLGGVGPASIAVDVGGAVKGVTKASAAAKSINMTPEKMASRRAQEQVRQRLSNPDRRRSAGKAAVITGTEMTQEANR